MERKDMLGWSGSVQRFNDRVRYPAPVVKTVTVVLTLHDVD